MNMTFLFIMLFQVFIESSQKLNEDDIIFEIVTDKKIEKLKYHITRQTHVNIQLAYKNMKNYLAENLNMLSDRVIWNAHLPKPFYITVFFPINKNSPFDIEFIGKNNIYLNTCLFRVQLKYPIVKPFVFTKDKTSTMHYSFDTRARKNDVIAVSEKKKDQMQLKTSMSYITYLELSFAIVRSVNDYLKKALNVIRDLELEFNKLASIYNLESVDNVYSNTICKICIHIYFNASRLFTLEKVEEDLIIFDKIKDVIIRLDHVITHKLLQLREKIDNDEDMATLDYIEQRYITEFREKIIDYKQFETIRLPTEKMNDILTLS